MKPILMLTDWYSGDVANVGISAATAAAAVGGDGGGDGGGGNDCKQIIW